MKYLLLALVGLGLAGCATETVVPALYGTLAGRVLDARTNQPLASVVVSTVPATSGFLTDAKGQFSISQVPAGTVALSVHKTDYADQTLSVIVSQDQTQTVALLLERASATAPPAAASQPSLAHATTGLPTQVLLGWRTPGAARADSLRYTVMLYEGASVYQRELLTNARDTSVLATGLRYGTVYYWQVTTRNPAGASARSVLWSFQTQPLPDNRVLFARLTGASTNIFSATITGTSLVQLTTGTTTQTAPQLSPNRDQVAYTSNATGQFQLYTMSRDGSNQRRISTLAVEGYNNAGVGYRWSPDGAQLLYAHYDQLYRINRDGTGLQLLATAPPGRHFRECDWTVQGGSGGRLVVQTVGVNVYDAELYLLNVDGSNPVLLLSNLPGRLDSPSFSLDGSRVLYTRDVAGFNSATGRQLDAHLFTQRLDGTGLLDVTTANNVTKPVGTNDLTPRYSPDGYSIVYVNQANDNLTPGSVFTIEASGNNRALAFGNAALPDWK